ncbi:MAG: hypothetical protein K2K67_10505, partial [Treponemataceae bacterium]|nr:hypothetical protein [Treponemataceae bacterium]
KKMLLLLAGMACLGMFVSCSDDPQEVVIVDSVDTYFEWAGDATADSITYVKTSSYDTNKYSLSFDTDTYCKLTYSTGSAGNIKSYNLEIPVIETIKYGDDDTRVEENEIRIYLEKLGNDYYYNGKKLTLTGSPEDKDFTIASVKANGYTFTNLKFTRK